MHHRNDDGTERADTCGFNRRGNTAEQQTKNQTNQRERRDQVAEKLNLLFQTDPVFRRNRRPKLRVYPAANQHVGQVQA